MHNPFRSFVSFFAGRHLLVALIFLYGFATAFAATSLTQFVNPFIGMQGKEGAIEGRTHPGEQIPFGMVSMCPFNAYDSELARGIGDHRRFQAPYFRGRPCGMKPVTLPMLLVIL